MEAFYSINAGSRLFWPYLLSSLIIALFFINKNKIFSKGYWLSSSLIVDLKILIFNKFLKIFIILPLEGLLIFKFTKFSYLLFSDSTPFFKGSSFSLLVMSLLYLFLDDAFKFLQHVMMHKSAFLWNFHKVHHSASTLNPLTLYRIHPVELVIASIRRVLVTLLLSVFVTILFGEFLSFPKVMGVHVFYFAFNLLGGNLRHSHVHLSFSILEHIFISPAQHQIHHSKDPKDFDKNFGVCFSFWDKLFGSFKRSDSQVKIKYGLNYRERKGLGRSFENLILNPFHIYFRESTFFKPLFSLQKNVSSFKSSSKDDLAVSKGDC